MAPWLVWVVRWASQRLYALMFCRLDAHFMLACCAAAVHAARARGWFSAQQADQGPVYAFIDAMSNDHSRGVARSWLLGPQQRSGVQSC
jgi:hypothetical protein